MPHLFESKQNSLPCHSSRHTARSDYQRTTSGANSLLIPLLLIITELAGCNRNSLSNSPHRRVRADPRANTSCTLRVDRGDRRHATKHSTRSAATPMRGVYPPRVYRDTTTATPTRPVPFPFPSSVALQRSSARTRLTMHGKPRPPSMHTYRVTRASGGIRTPTPFVSSFSCSFPPRITSDAPRRETTTLHGLHELHGVELCSQTNRKERENKKKYT